MRPGVWIVLGLLVGLGTFTLTGTDVYADDGDKLDQERAREAVLKGEVAPLAEALKVVDEKFEGEVVEVELEDEYSGLVYEIKMLQPDGRVLEIELDAKTLKILDVED